MRLTDCILDMLEEGVQSQSEKRGEWDGSKIHASDLAYGVEGGFATCPRKLALRWTGAERKEPHRGEVLMFEFGHSIQDRVRRYLQRAEGWGYKVLGERVPCGDEEIEAELDLLIWDEEIEAPIVLEVKSVRGGRFRYLDKEGPSPDHVIQLQAYLKLFGQAPYGCLLYVDREGQNFARAYHVECNDAAVDEALAKIRALRAEVEQDRIPDPIPPQVKMLKRKPKDPKDYHHEIEGQWHSVTEAVQCDWCAYKGHSCPGALAFWKEGQDE